MSLNIADIQFPEAFVGVPYEAEITASGGTEAGSFEYIWDVAAKPSLSSSNPIRLLEPAPELSRIQSNTGLPDGLTWSATGATLTIFGTPSASGFDDSVVVYPVRRAPIEFRVALSGDFPEESYREVSILINRIVDESTAQAYIRNFSEPNGLIKQEVVMQALDGIDSVFKVSDDTRWTKTINDFAKNIGSSVVKQDQNGEFNIYYELPTESDVYPT